MAARSDLPVVWERTQTAAVEVGAHLGSVAAGVWRWTDPRARALRARRSARMAGVVLGGGTGALGVSTAGMAVAGAGQWMVLGGGAMTTVAAGSAVAVTLRWLRLKRTPLPSARVVAPRRPGRGSAAHEPLLRLDAAERSVSELLGLLGRDPAVPPAEVEEARTAARAAAAALRSQAADVAALERARECGPAAAVELEPVVAAALDRLRGGVHSYHGLVAAAARAVAAGSGSDGHSEPLIAAVDRVDALTAALTELAGLHTGRS